MKKVGILMGSISDKGIVDKAVKMLEKFDVPYEIKVLSAHRTPDEAIDFAKNARKNDFSAIIAAAGKAAHLGGIIAAYTTLPVIGIPVKASALDGMDALLSIVQMPAGIPVASVAIDGAANAALLAIEMMAVYDKGLEEKLANYRLEMKNEVLEANNALY